MTDPSTEMTFWDHLDALRAVLIRIVVAVVAMTIVMFCFKEQLFAVVLAPSTGHFVTYRLIGAEAFRVTLINTLMTGQFMMHVKVAYLAAVVVASPYILFELFRFLAPALYPRERHYSVLLTVIGYGLFCIGVATCYFIVFPFTVHFLAGYQVSGAVTNMLTLDSYMDTLLMLSLFFGIVFELPVVSWFLARIGLLHASLMRRYRRHAVVAILIVAAIITPTSDAFTLTLVALPILLLYEVSILICKGAERQPIEKQ